MKKIVNKFLISVLVVIGLAGVLMFCSYLEHNYSRTCNIIKIKNNEVFCEDTCGHVWSFCNERQEFINDLSIGQTIILKMNTNCTDDNIFDDYITSYKIE